MLGSGQDVFNEIKHFVGHGISTTACSGRRMLNFQVPNLNFKPETLLSRTRHAKRMSRRSTDSYWTT